MITLLYPERRAVTEATIITWANDAFANGEVEAAPEDLEHAIYMLQDAGMITVQARG